MKRAALRAALFEGGEVLLPAHKCVSGTSPGERLSTPPGAKAQIRSRTRFTVGSRRWR
jgi:hypothetical protein